MILFEASGTALETPERASGQRLPSDVNAGRQHGSRGAIPLASRDPDGLRLYQREAVRAAFRELASNRATMAVLATGLGKTQLGAVVCKEWKTWAQRWSLPGLSPRVLWLAHRDELLGQAQRRIEQITGELTSLEQAGWYASSTRIVIGSVQTMRGPRLDKWPADTFGLIVTDESHHSTAKGYRAVYDQFPGAKLFGLTATPDRLDKVGMHNVWDSVCFKMDVDDAMGQGFLVPAVTLSALIDGVDLARIKTVGGDLQLEAVEEEILKAAAAIVDATLEHVGDRRSLTFTPGVASAHKVCDTHNERNPGSAHVVDGKTPQEKRREIFRAHKRGEFQHLVNCMVATEGYDDVGIRAIINARPTKSRALATQIWGRGLRVLDGIGELATIQDRVSAIAASAKPNCLLLDITGEPGKHKLIGPVDVLGGKYTSDEIAVAKEAVAKQPQDVAEALREAREYIQAQDDERKRLEARAAAQADVRRRSGVWDPFQDGGVKDPDAMRPSFLAKPSTPKQKSWALHNFLSPDLSCEQLRKCRGTSEVRERLGLASFRQLGLLRQAGLPADMKTSYEQAAGLLRHDQAQQRVEQVGRDLRRAWP